MKSLLPFVLLTLTLGCTAQPLREQTESVRREEQPAFALIPKPDPRVFIEANTLEKWKNPFLFVHPDGVELVSKDRNVQHPRVSISEIEAVLIALPADAWPLGRAVAVQENALGSGQAQTANVMAVKAMLD